MPMVAVPEQYGNTPEDREKYFASVRNADALADEQNLQAVIQAGGGRRRPSEDG